MAKLPIQDYLENLANTQNVYFEPPESFKMIYPCIRFSLDGFDNTLANDDIFIQKRVYEIVVIDRHVKSDIVDRLSSTLGFRFIRKYTAENLHHTIFRLSY